jgi:hypothetical protein
MFKLFSLIICLLLNSCLGAQIPLPLPIDHIKLSQQLLYAVKTEGDSVDTYMQQLQAADVEVLQAQLTTDALKKAFWLNIYNTYVQWLLQKDPERYKTRSSFFSGKLVPIAGRVLSLDDIEHGILRRSRVKWSLGHIGKLFPNSFEKNFRVDVIDERIHFALNCGAKSCPPIAYYAPEKMDAQLELSTKNYLRSEVEYHAEKNVAYLPAIMSWFRADFGGKKGMRALLKKHNINTGQKPSIQFKKYNWELFLNNYNTDQSSI